MKTVALLVFGQFRTASIILQHNLQQIKKSISNDSDIQYHIYIRYVYPPAKAGFIICKHCKPSIAT